MAGPFIPVTGPYGTFQIPSSLGPAFGMPQEPAPLGPPPTFQPGEIEGAVLGDVPRVTEPPPPIAPEPPPLPPAAPVDIAPTVTRGPLPVAAPQPFVTPDEQAALTANRGPGPQPQPPAPAAPPPAPGTLASMYANLEQRKDIARRKAELAASTGDAEAAAYDAANVEEARLTKARDAERAQVNKELGVARAKQASAMDAFVNHKVDQNRLWHNMGTGSKILAGIGVALSGLGNALAKKGDARNPALDLIMGAIKDDVALQLSERDKLGQVANMRKDAVNDLRVQYADGEAAFNGIVAGLTRRTANQVAAIGARAKSPDAKLYAENFATELNAEADKMALEADARDQAARQQAFENKMKASQVGLGWAQHKRGIVESDRAYDEGKRRFDAELDLKRMDALAGAEAARAKGNEAEAKRLEKEAEKAKKEADDIRNLSIGGGSKKVVTGPDGKPFVEYQPLKQRDGTVYKAPDKLAEPLQKKKASVDNLVQLMDDTVNLIDRYGYEPGIVKTDAWQQMQANWAAMAIDEKTIAELGVLAGPDMGLIAKKLGTGDPTSFIDQTAGIRKGRQNTLNKFDAELRAANYTGPRYDIPEITDVGVREKVKNTPVGELNAKAQERKGGFESAASGQGIRDQVVSVGDIFARTPGLAHLAPKDASRTSGFPGASVPTDEAERAVWGLVAVAGAGNEQARQALQVMANDKNPRIRELIRQVAIGNPGFKLEMPKAAK